MSPSWWRNETLYSKSRMPRCDSLPQMRAKSIVPHSSASRPKKREESRQSGLVEGARRKVAQFGNRDRPENSSPCASTQVFLMEWQRRSCRRTCLKVHWWSWGSTDQEAIGVGAICLQDLEAEDRGAPRAIVGCNHP